MSNEENQPIPGVPNLTADFVLETIDELSKAVEGKRADVVLTALTCMIGGAITGPNFTVDQKRAGALYLLSMASKITADLGISGTEIMEALGGGNAKTQPV